MELSTHMGPGNFTISGKAERVGNSNFRQDCTVRVTKKLRTWVVPIQELIILLLFLGVLNIVAFFSYYNDKMKAKNDIWRTPESTLLLWGLTGPFGAYLAMRMFRHKTRKTKFLLVPVFCILQVLLISYGLARLNF